MKFSNNYLLKFISSLSPWLAPIPSAYFVARSSIHNLEIPIVIGILIGLIIETIGFSSVHLYITLLQWNNGKRKSDPKAPDYLALILVFSYFLITVTLSVILEVTPKLAVFVPALFPILSLIGAFILSLLFQHEQRINFVQQEKINKSEKRHAHINTEQEKMSNLPISDSYLLLANEARKEKKNKLLEQIEEIISEQPLIGVTELKRILGVRSRTTIYSYISELKEAGRIK